MQLRKHHDKIVLDWGFPPRCLPWVEELRKSGVKLVWFNGDIDRARQVFVQRGGMAVQTFENQITDIRNANFPASLDCVVIERLPATGKFMDNLRVADMIFSRGRSARVSSDAFAQPTHAIIFLYVRSLPTIAAEADHRRVF
jgi:hypothetical protein